MRRLNWGELIWLAFAVIAGIAMLADIIGGQDPYRNEVLMMLALLLADVNDEKEDRCE